MFYKHTETGYHPTLPGIEIKTLVYGEKSLLTEFHLTGGNLLPRHAHPNEQTGYLISGHIRLSIGAETFDVLPGDSWNIPANIEHGAKVILDSVAVEIFSPVREDYLPERG